MKNFAGLLLMGAGLVSSAAGAGTADGATAGQVAARFGALESIQQISLSPEGTKAAYITPFDDGAVLYVADLTVGGAPKAITRLLKENGRLSSCTWSTETRLICQVVFVDTHHVPMLTYTRVLALDSDGSNLLQLSSRTSTRALGVAQNGGWIIDWDLEGEPNKVLMTRDFVPENTINTRLASDAEGLGVEMVDIQSGRRRTVEKASLEANTYLSDGHGNVRIIGLHDVNGSGTLTGKLRYYYRKVGSRKWDELARLNVDGTVDEGFDPVAVDARSNSVFGFEVHDGYQGLYSVALDGSLEKRRILARTDVDVDGLVRIGRQNRVVGVSYATDRRRTEFFDPELNKLSQALHKALPGQPSIGFLDASRGETKLLLEASSDTDPGMVYLFDKASRKLEAVLPLRASLADFPLAPMKAITYPAADGTMIPAYLTLPLGSSGKNLPAIVMPHGGPSARDEWGFDWLAQFFAARGYAVLQPNYRGSSGYGAAWYKENGFKSWRTAIGDVNDAGRWLAGQGIAAQGKLAIVGWSYGGYAALQSAVLDPDLFKAIVAVAPVTDLEKLREESQGFTSSALVDKFIGHGPHVIEGSPARNAARIKAPVLMFHGDLDQNVGVAESRFMADKLRDAGKSVTYVEFKDLDHQLRSAAARTRVLSESDAFIRKNLGLK
ncbi:alpha/beta hydrolase family protein [Novosphingobium mangrovi (ex Huang et al. 2023)]|uniref:S9 family peptidase n=1 Tax=Novosphingobium mangrovi (ex Huang et al. 2023) TaxID=2976432 RepID=A0ABT2I7N7_9SPHN|nr:S9 family peptidase [Novosphingobium mangrovi (ex Huang et al. 2023)]MCT2400845.1 S9 family peptidase [Novosphingobium mangrovi (ex Huang et al. 2023)]